MARDALKLLLGKALDKAAANSAWSSKGEQPLAPNTDSVPQRIRIGFVGTGTITTAVVCGPCGADHHVVSFISTVLVAELAALLAPAADLARAVPMPPMARRRGP